jgi:hypothetical protein
VFDAEDDELEMEEGSGDCPCCNGGKGACSHGKDPCGTCGGTGKVTESSENSNRFRGWLYDTYGKSVEELTQDEYAKMSKEFQTHSKEGAHMNELRQLAGLQEGGDCYHCDGEDEDCEYCHGTGYVGAEDDPNEPSQDEIDAHYEIYKKHAEKGSQEENLDLSNVVESIVGEKRIDELGLWDKVKDQIGQFLGKKFGRDETLDVMKRMKAFGGPETGFFIIVDEKEQYGPFDDIDEMATFQMRLGNAMLSPKSTATFGEPDTSLYKQMTDKRQKANPNWSVTKPVEPKESAPYEPLISEMGYSDLLDYLGVTREEALMDLQDYYAPEQVHKDNIEEYEDKYREDVLEPAAEEISSGHAEPANPEDEYQEETIELDEFQPDDVAFAPDEEPEWIVIDKDGNEVPGGTMLKGTREPTFIIAAIPPTNDSLAKIQTNNGKIQIPNDWGYYIKRNHPNEPKQGELPLPTPDPHQPELPNLATPQAEPEVEEGADIIELKKRAGL